jgi:hypothetical protein
MANFYIAGKFQDRDKVQEIQEKVKSAGHRITHDWTRHDPIKPYHEKLEKAQKYAEHDIDGVRDADYFVMFPHSGGRTLHAELGAAIAFSEEASGPEIYLLGEHNDPGMIYFHPRINKIDNIGEILNEL